MNLLFFSFIFLANLLPGLLAKKDLWWMKTFGNNRNEWRDFMVEVRQQLAILGTQKEKELVNLSMDIDKARELDTTQLKTFIRVQNEKLPKYREALIENTKQRGQNPSKIPEVFKDFRANLLQYGNHIVENDQDKEMAKTIGLALAQASNRLVMEKSEILETQLEWEEYAEKVGKKQKAANYLQQMNEGKPVCPFHYKQDMLMKLVKDEAKVLTGLGNLAELTAAILKELDTHEDMTRADKLAEKVEGIRKETELVREQLLGLNETMSNADGEREQLEEAIRREELLKAVDAKRGAANYNLLNTFFRNIEAAVKKGWAELVRARPEPYWKRGIARDTIEAIPLALKYVTETGLGQFNERLANFRKKAERIAEEQSTKNQSYLKQQRQIEQGKWVQP